VEEIRQQYRLAHQLGVLRWELTDPVKRAQLEAEGVVDIAVPRPVPRQVRSKSTEIGC
jgi:hypothetical protein